MAEADKSVKKRRKKQSSEQATPVRATISGSVADNGNIDTSSLGASKAETATLPNGTPATDHLSTTLGTPAQGAQNPQPPQQDEDLDILEKDNNPNREHLPENGEARNSDVSGVPEVGGEVAGIKNSELGSGVSEAQKAQIQYTRRAENVAKIKQQSADFAAKVKDVEENRPTAKKGTPSAERQQQQDEALEQEGNALELAKQQGYNDVAKAEQELQQAQDADYQAQQQAKKSAQMDSVYASGDYSELSKEQALEVASHKFGGGDVDIANHPRVDASLMKEWGAAEGEQGDGLYPQVYPNGIMVTPIVNDPQTGQAQVMSPKELARYVDSLDPNNPASDQLGLVISWQAQPDDADKLEGLLAKSDEVTMPIGGSGSKIQAANQPIKQTISGRESGETTSEASGDSGEPSGERERIKGWDVSRRDYNPDNKKDAKPVADKRESIDGFTPKGEEPAEEATDTKPETTQEQPKQQPQSTRDSGTTAKSEPSTTEQPTAKDNKPYEESKDVTEARKRVADGTATPDDLAKIDESEVDELEAYAKAEKERVQKQLDDVRKAQEQATKDRNLEGTLSYGRQIQELEDELKELNDPEKAKKRAKDRRARHWIAVFADVLSGIANVAGAAHGASPLKLGSSVEAVRKSGQEEDAAYEKRKEKFYKLLEKARSESAKAIAAMNKADQEAFNAHAKQAWKEYEEMIKLKSEEFKTRQRSRYRQFENAQKARQASDLSAQKNSETLEQIQAKREAQREKDAAANKRTHETNETKKQVAKTNASKQTGTPNYKIDDYYDNKGHHITERTNYR